MKIINLFKYKHKWKSQLDCNMISEGVDEFYRCRCGATKIKYMSDKKYYINERNDNK